MNPEIQKDQMLKDYDIVRSYSFETDLVRDKAILNFSFAIFMGLLAFFNTIRFNTLSVICGILAMLFSLISIYLSLKVLKANSYLAARHLADPSRTNMPYQHVITQLLEQNIKDGTWAYRSLWATIVCVVFCVLFYSGIKVEFVQNTPEASVIIQEQCVGNIGTSN